MANESVKFWDKTAARYAKDPVSDEATYQRKLAETQSFFAPEMRIKGPTRDGLIAALGGGIFEAVLP